MAVVTAAFQKKSTLEANFKNFCFRLANKTLVHNMSKTMCKLILKMFFELVLISCKGLVAQNF